LTGFGVPDDETTEGLLSQTGGHVPYTERDLFDAVLTGRTDTIPDALRPVADTLSALRAAPAAAELSAEASARAEFRAVMRQAWTATTPDVPAVPAHTLIIPLPAAGARPRRAARHRRRRSATGSARVLSPTVLFGAAAAAVVVLALGLTTLVPRSLHSIVHPGSAMSVKPPATLGTVPRTAAPSALNASASAEPTPTPTPQPPAPATLCHEFFNLLIAHPHSMPELKQESTLIDELTRLAGSQRKIFGYCAQALAAQDGHHPPFGQGDPLAPTREQQGSGAAGSQTGTGATGNQGGTGPQQP
jgi:hypothetical protein